MLGESNKCSIVTATYQSLVRSVYANKYIKTNPPAVGTKHWENCVKFYDLAEEVGVPLISLMASSVKSYTVDWCQRTFHRKYPPITVVVSEASRSRGLKNFPKIVSVGTEPANDEIVKFYADQLEGYSERVVLGLLANGFLPEESMQGPVMEILEKRWAHANAG